MPVELLLALGLGLAVVSMLSWLVVAFNRAKGARMALLDAESEIAQTAAGPVEYALLGDAGPVVLFLHGSPGGYDNAEPLDNGFRTLAPSRPGYLRTPLEVGATASEQAAAMAALLDQLEIDQVIVFAVSGGGPAGLCFAADFPERTVALVAAEAVSGATPLPKMPSFPGLDFLLWVIGRAVWATVGSRGLIRMMIPDPANRAKLLEDPKGLERFNALFAGVWPLEPRVAGANNDSVQFAGLELPLERIVAPTLVIHGTADINVPYAHGQRIADQIPGARLHTIDGGDHMMPFTHAAEFERVLTAFLEYALTLTE